MSEDFKNKLSDKLLIIVSILLIATWLFIFIFSVIKYENNQKELKDKAQKYDAMMEVKDE